MVNTFFVDENVYISAKCLDFLRLNKQTSECLTIYRNIINLKILANYYKIELPKDDYEIYDWIRMIVAKYKKEEFNFLFKENGELIGIDKKAKVIVQSFNQIIIFDNEKEVILQDIKGKQITVNKNLFVSLKDKYIKLGYIYHPAILLWFNYIPALKHYINVHVAECKKRGAVNSINIESDEYNKGVDPEYPAWSKDPDFLIRHRSNLIKKDSVHYKKIWPSVNNDLKYFWPYALKVGSNNGISDKDKRYK